MQYILYILAIMIFWDFSTHVIEMFGKWDYFTHSKSFLSYYYPHIRYKKTPKGPVERKNWRKFYQRFWVSYWGIAFLLIVVYIFFH